MLLGATPEGNRGRHIESRGESERDFNWQQRSALQHASTSQPECVALVCSPGDERARALPSFFSFPRSAWRFLWFASSTGLGFIRELRRRRVLRVTAVYTGTAFVLLQLGEILVEPFGLSDWTLRMVTSPGFGLSPGGRVGLGVRRHGDGAGTDRGQPRSCAGGRPRGEAVDLQCGDYRPSRPDHGTASLSASLRGDPAGTHVDGSATSGRADRHRHSAAGAKVGGGASLHVPHHRRQHRLL